MGRKARRPAQDELRRESDRTRRRVASRRPLCFERLESRELLTATANVADVPVWDGERQDSGGSLVNYLGGNVVAAVQATVSRVADMVHSGQAAYRLDTVGPIAAGNFAFVQMTVGAAGFPTPYLDTRDLTHYQEVSLWVRNRSGTPFTLELGLKDYRDSNDQQARWLQVVPAADQWVQIRAQLDLTPRLVTAGQPGWVVNGQPDLSRARSLSVVINADQGSAVSGAIYLDDVVLTEPGGPVDPTQTPVAALAQQLAKRAFDALWGARDRSTGLVPGLSTYENVMATNVTAALVKSLPGAVSRGWLSPAAADGYVTLLTQTLGQIMNHATYLPARYVDRVSLEPNYKAEESSIDAALMYLALEQYKSQLSSSSATLGTSLGQLLGRFDFAPFATAQGWRMSYDPVAENFSADVYNGYSGEIGLISLAAQLANQLDITALYHSGVNRAWVTSLDGAAAYLVSANVANQAPFLQWLFPLFVDVSQRGLDNYPVASLASNPWDNAVRYQQDVETRLTAAGRGAMLQPDAGDDYSGTAYQQYSVFDNFSKPSLFMPWSVSFALLAAPADAGAALQRMLAAGLQGPFGLVDSAYWDTGAEAPYNVAARFDLWNTALSLLALEQYLYQDNQFLTSVPAVASALDKVFHAPPAVSPAAQFLLASTNLSARSQNASDLGQPIVPLYTDFHSGGDYFNINDSVRMSLDGNDSDAARGLSSFRATWDGTGPNGYFQFGWGTAGPRAIPDFGFAQQIRFLAKGDQAGQQVRVNVFRTLPGGGYELLPTASRVVSLEATGWSEITLDLPAGLQPSDLQALQFVLGDGLDAGKGTFRLDELRIDTDGYDPAQLAQSYRPTAWARTDSPANSPPGRDVNVYPDSSFLYDDALASMALWATGDVEARAAAQRMADALAATVQADGSYYNQRNSGHLWNADGTLRNPFSQLRTLGDNAWWGLALLDLYAGTGVTRYLDLARGISDWAETELRDPGSLQGYRGGFDGAGNPLLWRSTEHNIDLFALNGRLAAELTKRNAPEAATYAQRASAAGTFVMAMFDPVAGKFWTGTGAGDTINRDSVPLDVQLWASLTLGLAPQYATVIDWNRPRAWAEAQLQTTAGPYAGFTFSDQTTPHRVWFEGTAQAAVLYAVQGDLTKYALTLDEVEFARLHHPHGDGQGVVAVSNDDTTDSLLGAVYDARLHLGASAWLYFAEEQINPFASLIDGDAVAPHAALQAPGAMVCGDKSYQPNADPKPGFNLVSWADFGAHGASTWTAAVQDLYSSGYRSVSFIPVRYVDVTTGAMSAGPQAPQIADIAAGIAKAHALGMTVTVNPLVEPQGFSTWRGNLQFTGAAAQQFFTDYGSYLGEVAGAAQANGADRMTIGSELRGLMDDASHQLAWASVIESVAGVFHGALGYAANWDDYDHANLTTVVWENPHLQFIGVDFYPPLATTSQADASATEPSFVATVQAQWTAALNTLRSFAAARKGGTGMPVVLTEVGLIPYNRTTTAPSSAGFVTSQAVDSDEQTKAFTALLRATADTAAWLPELYVWHWTMPGDGTSAWQMHPDDPLSGPATQLLDDHVNFRLSDFGFHTFTVAYTDNAAIQVATLDHQDLVVTGPNGFSQPATLVAVDTHGDGTPRLATYQMTAPGGTWTSNADGTYYVTLQANQVSDTSHTSATAGTIGTFTVNVWPWQNHTQPCDVDADRLVKPLDALVLINAINLQGSRRLVIPPAFPDVPPVYYDVFGDNSLTAQDVLVIINYLNNPPAAAGEGESPRHTRVALPDAPDLLFVGGLRVVAQQRGGQGPAGPGEPDPLLRLPAFQDGVQQAPDKTIAAADPIQDGDFARLLCVPVVAFQQDGAPEMAVGADDLAQRRGEDLGVGKGSLGALDHALETVDFGRQALPARLRPFNSQAELKVLLVPHQDVGQAGDLQEDLAQLLLAVLPEGGAMVEIESNPRPVLAGGSGQCQAEGTRLRR